IMGERLAYLPSAGFCLLVALALNWLRERQQYVGSIVLACIIGAMGIRTVVRNFDWKDYAALHAASATVAPGSAKVHRNLASVYINTGKLDLAEREAHEALRIYPDYPDAMEYYGLIKCWKGDYREGAEWLKKALNMSSRATQPRYDYMMVNYAAALIQTD